MLDVFGKILLLLFCVGGIGCVCYFWYLSAKIERTRLAKEEAQLAFFKDFRRYLQNRSGD